MVDVVGKSFGVVVDNLGVGFRRTWLCVLFLRMHSMWHLQPSFHQGWCTGMVVVDTVEVDSVVVAVACLV